MLDFYALSKETYCLSKEFKKQFYGIEQIEDNQQISIE